MATAVSQPIPWYNPPRIARAVFQARRYPVLPVVILVFSWLFPPCSRRWWRPHDPLKGSLSKRLKPPVWAQGGIEYPLGTDKMGRDLLSRMIYGARVSLLVSFITVFVGGSMGTALGVMSGYFGGKLDTLIMRLVDIELAIPTILLALILVSALGPSFGTVIMLISLVIWTRYARQARAETMIVKEQDFVARARVAGASHSRIMVRYILPNIVNTLVVLATLQVGTIILLESTLSFLGVGIPRPTPAWGVMVADGRELIVTAWWVSMFPGIGIMLTVLSLNLFGDWLRDHLDPKLKHV